MRIALVYPSLLGTYGDGGNASVLAQRLRWRGIDAATVDVAVDEPVPGEADLYVLGGGEDTAQTLAVSRLGNGTLRAAADAGKVVFAVCAGFQIIGETWLDGHGDVHPGLGLIDCRTDRLPGARALTEQLADRAGFQIIGETWLDGHGDVHPGLGLIDCRTDRLPGARAVGELLGEPAVDGIDAPLTGYENHGGRTVLGPAARPLAHVRSGVGNGADDVDGAVQGTVVATYLHGPALARNPALADWLLEQVVGPLDPLDDSEEDELRRERLSAVRRARAAWWRRQWRPPARG